MSRASRENFERKTLEKNKIDSSPIFKFLYSHPFYYYILERYITKTFSHYTQSVRRPFGVWEAVKKGPISYWLMLWAIVESGKLKKKQVSRNLVGVVAWRV